MDAKEMGKRIKLTRNKLGLTQQAFASELGVEQGYISNIERGVRMPSEVLIRYICLKFNITEMWMREGKGEMFISPEQFIKQQIAHYGEQAILDVMYPGTTHDAEGDTAGIQCRDDDSYITDKEVLEKILYGCDGGLNRSSRDNEMIDLFNLPDSDYLQMAMFLINLWRSDDRRLKDWIVIQFGLAFPDVRITGVPSNAKQPELIRIITYLYGIFKSNNQRLKNWAIIQFEKNFPDYVFF